MKQCLSCGGIYSPTNADGTAYYHACPPLSAPELAAVVAKGKIALPAGETVDVAIARRSYERANKRNENPPSTSPADAGKLTSPGAGVVDVAALPTPTVVVNAAISRDGAGAIVVT